jgi:hypothetical protein
MIRKGPMMPAAYSTDVIIACHCPDCNGAEAIITSRKYKHICRRRGTSRPSTTPSKEGRPRSTA